MYCAATSHRIYGTGLKKEGETEECLWAHNNPAGNDVREMGPDGLNDMTFDDICTAWHWQKLSDIGRC